MEPDGMMFVTCIDRPEHFYRVRTLVESIRDFGGDHQVLVYVVEELSGDVDLLTTENLVIRSLHIPSELDGAWFASKVTACAAAESCAQGKAETLVWVSPDTLILNLPVQLDLASSADAAVRPVHMRNIGLAANEPVDAFWEGVYRQVGVENCSMQVESYVDEQLLAPYFNSHLVAVRPELKIFREWLEHFTALAVNQSFQHSACGDELHRIFLHQAVLSVLLAGRVGPERLRILPPEYSYPYNLQSRIPESKRAKILNSLVCAAVEERSLNPDEMDDIEVLEPLCSWLRRRVVRK